MEAERCSERQYLPTEDHDRVQVQLEQLLGTLGQWLFIAERFDICGSAGLACDLFYCAFLMSVIIISTEAQNIKILNYC